MDCLISGDTSCASVFGLCLHLHKHTLIPENAETSGDYFPCLRFDQAKGEVNIAKKYTCISEVWGSKSLIPEKLVRNH